MTGKLKHYLRTIGEIDEQQLDGIIGSFKLKKVKRNTVLLSAGEIGFTFYFVHSGCVRTYYLTSKGHEKTRFIAFDGTMVTAMASFISQQPSFEFLETLEDTELYAMSHTDFYRLVNEYSGWNKFYKTLLERAYLYQNKKIEGLVTLSATQLYHKLLSENPFYIQRLSNKILASYLDITQETLSRLKSK